MTSRKISQQQKHRIKKNRRSESGDLGIVIINYGKTCEVEVEGEIFTCKKRSNVPNVVCGDRVKIAKKDNSNVVIDLETRNVELNRPDKRNKSIPVAANITQIVIVVAPIPKPNLTTVDRYLIACRNLKIKPVLLLNKVDLLNSNNNDVLSKFNYYKSLGVKTISNSCIGDKTNTELLQVFNNETSIVVGQSGVGKSSVVNKIMPEALALEGKISEKAELGMHTTTASRLYHLGSGDLIDSPGIREFPLWPMSTQELCHGFDEFSDFECRFRDCSHQNENGCAVNVAVLAGKIAKWRYDSYLKILDGFKV